MTGTGISQVQDFTMTRTGISHGHEISQVDTYFTRAGVTTTGTMIPQ